LSLIEFIDSAGVAMLVELRKMAQKRYTISINLEVSSVIKKMLQFYDVKNLLEVGNEC
jgi:ABC-type transporter Mla MlaB component